MPIAHTHKTFCLCISTVTMSTPPTAGVVPVAEMRETLDVIFGAFIQLISENPAAGMLLLDELVTLKNRIRFHSTLCTLTFSKDAI
jgi:hypothetical protein